MFKMNKLTVCRVCLNANVSHRIPDKQIKEMYEKLTSISFQNATKPSLICYICHARLYKAHRLMMKCLKAEDIQTQMLNQPVSNKDRAQQESIQIDETEFTQLIHSAVNHIDIEPLPKVNQTIHFTFEEVFLDVKTEVESEEDIPGPVDDIQQPLDQSNVDNTLTCFHSEDDIPLNKLKQETETVTDKQNISRVEKNEPIGWMKGAPVASESKQEPQTNNTKVNKSKDNTDPVKSAVTPNYEVTPSMCSVKTETSTAWEDTTNENKHNDHDSVAKMENKYNQWSDLFEIQCNEEYIVDTLIPNEIDVSDEDRDNKKNLNLISNKTRINSAVIKNCVENVTFSDREYDTDDFKQRKIPQNNNTDSTSSTKDSHLTKQSENEKQYICDICRRIYSCKTGLQRHVRTHTGERPYSCKTCYKSFKQITHLRTHEITHTGERPYRCNMCDKGFTQISNLRSHERIHTGEKPYICNMCDKGFTRFTHLNRHKRIHTAKGRFSCKICDKSFMHISHLNKHEISHTEETPYRCNICDRGFKCFTLLNRHKLIHTRESPYRCNMCDKRFTRFTHLNRHNLIHTRKGFFTCKICDQSFTQISDFNSHKITHTGDRPYTCNVCDKGFKRFNHLNRHKLIHTRERLFSCKICEQRFAQISDLNSHVITHNEGTLLV